MAWYSAWKKWQRLVITVPSGTVAGLSYFPVLVTEASLSAAITDILANGRSDGGDFAFAADLGLGNSLSSIGAQQPCEVVSCSLSGTPAAEVHTQVPSVAATGTLTYLWIGYGNSGQTAQPAANSTYGSQNVWKENGTQNYIGVYHLSEVSNAQVKDSSANANHSSAAIFSSVVGKVGSAAGFNGSNQYINLPMSLTGLTQIHASGWGTWATSLGRWAPLLEWLKGYLAADPTDWNLYLVTATGPNPNPARSNDANPHRLSLNWDGSTAQYYVDGAKVAHASQGGTTALQGVTISTQSPYSMNGYADEVRFGLVARSVSWDAAEYANQNAPGTFVQTSGSPLSTSSSFNAAWAAAALGV